MQLQGDDYSFKRRFAKISQSRRRPLLGVPSFQDLLFIVVDTIHCFDRYVDISGDLVQEVVGAVQCAAELRPALLAPHNRVNILQTVTAQVTRHCEGVIQ